MPFLPNLHHSHPSAPPALASFPLLPNPPAPPCLPPLLPPVRLPVPAAEPPVPLSAAPDAVLPAAGPPPAHAEQRLPLPWLPQHHAGPAAAAPTWRPPPPAVAHNGQHVHALFCLDAELRAGNETAQHSFGLRVNVTEINHKHVHSTRSPTCNTLSRVRVQPKSVSKRAQYCSRACCCLCAPSSSMRSCVEDCKKGQRRAHGLKVQRVNLKVTWQHDCRDKRTGKHTEGRHYFSYQGVPGCFSALLHAKGKERCLPSCPPPEHAAGGPAALYARCALHAAPAAAASPAVPAAAHWKAAPHAVPIPDPQLLARTLPGRSVCARHLKDRGAACAF
eukprot:scaffold2281_cov19-Tisochrysis_lutea.AAC.2